MAKESVTGSWPRVAVLGAGAVGSYFGGMLARAGAPVTLIGRPSQVEAIGRSGVFLDSIHFREAIRVAASSAIAAARDAEIVLLCVKTPDTEEAAKSLAPHLATGAAVVSLQNGVDNVERIRAATGIEAIPAVVYVAAEVTAPGRVKHSGRGDLILGDLSGNARRATLDRIAATFERAGVPCKISENIAGDLWVKLILNCAYNAVSALTRARYGRITRDPGTREVMRQVTEECLAVAHAAGIRVPSSDMFAAVFKLGEAIENALSSTAQDIERGKRTEIDSLNGYVVRRGQELGVPTPVNQTLCALVRLLQEPA